MTEGTRRSLADRRTAPRFEILGDLWGTLDTVLGLPLDNISHGGALVNSSVALRSDSEHHVTISWDQKDVPTKVRVRRVERVLDVHGRESFRIGLEFVSIAPTLRAQIEAWLRANPPESDGLDEEAQAQ